MGEIGKCKTFQSSLGFFKEIEKKTFPFEDIENEKEFLKVFLIRLCR